MIASFRNWRVWIAEGYVFAALVLTAGVAVAAFLYMKQALNASDRERAVAAYRERAQAIRDGELPSQRRKVGELLVAHGRLGRGSWGFETVARDSVLVWYREPRQDSVGFAYVPREEAAFWRGSFAAFLGASLLTVLLLALLSVRHFRSFLKERDDFIAAVAHDLRTPIATLSMQTLKGPEELRQTAERLRKLVENLTEFLKLGGRRPAPKRERVELVALFREAYGHFREGYEDVGSSVAVEGAAELFAEADPDLVMQVFWNLLGNDLKYAAPEGPVKVRFSSEGCQAVVEFLDEGPGMSRSAMRRCFDRYYRATTIAESGKGGFGIGLCNAREFARAMRGSLEVRANVPRGCVFALRLPSAS